MAQVMYYYGSRPDSRDDRDLRKVYPEAQIPSSPSVDLRRYVDHVYNQGSLSSCSASAVCAAYGIELMKQSTNLNGEYLYFDPSRLFLYYNTRQYESTTQHDAGASLRDTIKALRRQGVCTDSDWPYAIKEYRTRPPARCYEAASGNLLSHYERLGNDINQLRACLSENSPFIFSFNVYHSFHDYSNQKFGDTSMPTYYEMSREPVGRHAAMAVGYDDTKKRVIALNSWGDGWGDRGYFYLPYDFITDPKLCFDFWKISFASERSGSGVDSDLIPCNFQTIPVMGSVGDAYGNSDCEFQSSEYEEYSSDCTDYATPYHQYNSACCCRLQ